MNFWSPDLVGVWVFIALAGVFLSLLIYYAIRHAFVLASCLGGGWKLETLEGEILDFKAAKNENAVRRFRNLRLLSFRLDRFDESERGGFSEPIVCRDFEIGRLMSRLDPPRAGMFGLWFGLADFRRDGRTGRRILKRFRMLAFHSNGAPLILRSDVRDLVLGPSALAEAMVWGLLGLAAGGGLLFSPLWPAVWSDWRSLLAAGAIGSLPFFLSLVLRSLAARKFLAELEKRLEEYARLNPRLRAIQTFSPERGPDENPKDSLVPEDPGKDSSFKFLIFILALISNPIFFFITALISFLEPLLTAPLSLFLGVAVDVDEERGRIESVGGLDLDSAGRPFARNVLFQSQNDGYKRNIVIPELRAAENLWKAGLIRAGTEGVWLIRRVKPGQAPKWKILAWYDDKFDYEFYDKFINNNKKFIDYDRQAVLKLIGHSPLTPWCFGAVAAAATFFLWPGLADQALLLWPPIGPALPYLRAAAELAAATLAWLLAARPAARLLADIQAKLGSVVDRWNYWLR